MLCVSPQNLDVSRRSITEQNFFYEYTEYLDIFKDRDTMFTDSVNMMEHLL